MCLNIQFDCYFVIECIKKYSYLANSSCIYATPVSAIMQSYYPPIFEKRKAIRTRKNFPTKYFGLSDNLMYSGISYLVESQMMTMNMQRLIKKTSNPIRKTTEVTPPWEQRDFVRLGEKDARLCRERIGSIPFLQKH
jgi:hypothetical protein